MVPVSENSILQRWADLTVQVLSAEKDPTTIAAWADHVHLGKSTLRGVCRAARVGCKDSLDLARVLRAVARLEGHPWLPAAVLGSRDPRTVRSLLERTGADGLADGATPRGFLARQRVLDPGGPHLAALRVSLDEFCDENSTGSSEENPK